MTTGPMTVLDDVDRLDAALGGELDEMAPPRRRRRRIGSVLAVGWLGLLVFVAAFHSWLPLERHDVIVGPPRQAPCLCLSEPFGTDTIGRSTTARLVLGARQSILVASVSVGIGFVVGGMIGVVAGYRKGWTDATIGLFVNAGLAFPPLVLLLAFASILEPSVTSITIALSVLFVFPFVRLARANTLALVNREFVLAARASGTSHARILLREIVPNVCMPLTSYAFVIIAAAMIAEGSLSYLGFGIPPPAPSWGGMIAAGRPYLATDPELVFVPSLALLLTVMSLNSLGDSARGRLQGGEVRIA